MLEEKFVALLQDAVEKVKCEEDPVTLNEYKKLFKENVPFTLRTYVAAYLAKSFAEAGKRDFGSKKEYGAKVRREKDNSRGKQSRISREITLERETRNEKENRIEREPRVEREPTPRITIDPELAATIFISIGRNRRVFPRDLIGLIIQNAGLDRARIAEIRVLDNYSFVQLYAEDCEKVIAALDGFEYRGRKLTVSYSRKKEDGESTEINTNESVEDNCVNSSINSQCETKPQTEEVDPLLQDELDRAAWAAAEKAAARADRSIRG